MIVLPSGDHVGDQSTCLEWVRFVRFDPSASATKMSSAPLTFRMNAMRVPSGDHAGSELASPPTTSTRFEPSASNVIRWPFRVATIRPLLAQSGCQACRSSGVQEPSATVRRKSRVGQ